MEDKTMTSKHADDAMCKKCLEMSQEPVALEYDDQGLPKAQGLYDPAYEKDACGVGFVVNINGEPTRKVCFH